MMRVTNSMIVKRSKSNINTNRAQVDHTNNQMATQKKITKPSDNPIIAIRSLRLRSTLSTITQYYENNIPDTESWMEVTETALKNMKDILTDAYEQVVYGATDSLNQDNRKTILKELQALQEQIYSEGNSDYAGRTVFTGYKTNQNLTFIDTEDAKNSHYNITESFNYKDITQKKYYSGEFSDTSDGTLLNDEANIFNERTLNRVRLAYDNISEKGHSLQVSYKDADDNPVNVEFSEDGAITIQGVRVNVDSATGVLDPIPGYTAIQDTADATKYKIYSNDDLVNPPTTPPSAVAGAKAIGTVKVTDSAPYSLQAEIGNQMISYTATDTSSLKKSGYDIADGTIVFDHESGEILFKDDILAVFDANKVDISFNYEKNEEDGTGFELGELRPENYFNCIKDPGTEDEIKYTNYDEDGKWITQGIYYNIAGGQQMQINSEAKDIFNSDIRRDMDDLIEVVQMAINAQTTVNEIDAKIKSGNYSDAELENLNAWKEAAEKQLTYANQNMHDTYSEYITNFKGYLDKVNLEITDVGGRGERVTLTKNRMSIQQSTFKELKSSNEDMELSDLVINYTAATVAYQAALQASAKIGKMTLLDYI